MATTPPKNDVFLREVDEEVRREQMMEFGRKYGIWVVALVLLALAALGGWLYWRHHQQEVAGHQGEQFQLALDNVAAGKVKDAQPSLATLAGSTNDGYRAMAEIAQADLALKNNDTKGAIAKFQAIAGDTSLARPFRDLALVRQTALQYDDLKPQQVVDRLRPLANKGNAWFGSAGEMVAIAYLQMNRRDLAGKMFGQIAQADGVPDSIRQRAVQMAALLNEPAAGQDKDKATK